MSFGKLIRLLYSAPVEALVMAVACWSTSAVPIVLVWGKLPPPRANHTLRRIEQRMQKARLHRSVESIVWRRRVVSLQAQGQP